MHAPDLNGRPPFRREPTGGEEHQAVRKNLLQLLIGLALVSSAAWGHPLSSLSVPGIRLGMRRDQVNGSLGRGKPEAFTPRHGNRAPITFTRTVYQRPGKGALRVQFSPNRPASKVTDTVTEIQADFAQIDKLMLQVGQPLPLELQPPKGRPKERYFTQGVVTYAGSTQWVFPVSGGFARLSVVDQKLTSITLSTSPFENQEVADWEDRNK